MVIKYGHIRNLMNNMKPSKFYKNNETLLINACFNFSPQSVFANIPAQHTEVSDMSAFYFLFHFMDTVDYSIGLLFMRLPLTKLVDARLTGFCGDNLFCYMKICPIFVFSFSEVQLH